MIVLLLRKNIIAFVVFTFLKKLSLKNLSIVKPKFNELTYSKIGEYIMVRVLPYLFQSLIYFLNIWYESFVVLNTAFINFQIQLLNDDFPSDFYDAIACSQTTRYDPPSVIVLNLR